MCEEILLLYSSQYSSESLAIKILLLTTGLFTTNMVGLVPGFSSIYPLPVAAMSVSTNMVSWVPGYFSIFPLPVAAKNVSTKMLL
jgi:hypothetical protein